MSKRLLDDGATELETLLLRAGQADAPPDPVERARRIEAIKSASQTAALVGGGLLGLRWLSGGWSALPRWVVFAGTGVAATAGVAYVGVASREPPRIEVAAPHVAVTAPALQASPRSPRSPRSVEPTRKMKTSGFVGVASPEATGMPLAAPPLKPAPVPVSEGRMPEGAPSTQEALAPIPSVKAPARTLREETAQLESARRLLEASRASDALAALDAYDVRFLGGMLNEEAAVLRVEALLALGNVAQAHLVVSKFEARYPASSYGTRIRELVEQKK